MSSEEPPRSTALLAVAWKVVAVVAFLGAAVLVAGFLLPGRWTARAETAVAAPVDTVYAWLEAPARWDRWTRWGDVGATPEGPERGVGARRSWDDPMLGDGVFEITGAEPPRRLDYAVEVQGGSLRTAGGFELSPLAGGGTRVVWVEEGDFGRNPLMAWAALNMGRIQRVELERSLARLAAVVEGREVPDSLELERATPPAPGGAGGV